MAYSKPQKFGSFRGPPGYYCNKPEVLRLRVDLGVKSSTLDKAIAQSSMSYMIWIREEDYKLLYEVQD